MNLIIAAAALGSTAATFTVVSDPLKMSAANMAQITSFASLNTVLASSMPLSSPPAAAYVRAAHLLCVADHGACFKRAVEFAACCCRHIFSWRSYCQRCAF
ncbi:unnamed protein product [Cuscuta epithymum]|uniref:Uncharacterized protein n=1 Tax=Cuscuta epithymum TaxID=186058 RepID=A0AAV0BVI2_9ASTE|nr:unnamed protein product [Cuscuta epithymum]